VRGVGGGKVVLETIEDTSMDLRNIYGPPQHPENRRSSDRRLESERGPVLHRIVLVVTLLRTEGGVPRRLLSLWEPPEILMIWLHRRFRRLGQSLERDWVRQQSCSSCRLIVMAEVWKSTPRMNQEESGIEASKQE
jgi:hypothetical protein